jgi:hypothetical protein
MSLSTGRNKLHSALKTLVVRWEETKTGWNDPVSQDFEETYWNPLESTAPAALRSIDQLDLILHRVRQECR